MNEYRETKNGLQNAVQWKEAVVLFATRISRYGSITGVSLATLALAYAGLPSTFTGWIEAAIIMMAAGGLFGGMAGGLALAVKDWSYPYQKPYQTHRTLPAAAAPAPLKPAPLSRTDGNAIRYGKQELEPPQLLALAQAVLVQGHNLISQRSLADWGIVPAKESAAAKQIKTDLEYLGYAIPAGNNQLRVTPPLRQHLADRFPDLAPLAPHPITAAPAPNGASTRHHHQTPLRTT